jgi:polysaccharide deacetylase family protein (PEP-CTERM system associated)
MKHIMTLDIEAWYHANFPNFDYRQYLGKVNDMVFPQANQILDFLDELGNKATFFVLGEIAESYPDLVKNIHSRGHEVASHFMHHELVYEMSSQRFKDELRQGLDLLQQLIGCKVLGFRAPSWSVTIEKTPWFWEILAEEGIIYSSSRFPFKTYMYGDQKSPLFAHTIETKVNPVREFPPSCLRLMGKTIPFSGGFYLRALPEMLIKKGIKWFEKRNQPVVFYLHPKEIDPTTPCLPVRFRDKLIHNFGTKGCLSKLRRILGSLQTISFAEFLQTKNNAN